jgi:hypothetical protein
MYYAADAFHAVLANIKLRRAEPGDRFAPYTRDKRDRRLARLCEAGHDFGYSFTAETVPVLRKHAHAARQYLSERHAPLY